MTNNKELIDFATTKLEPIIDDMFDLRENAECGDTLIDYTDKVIDKTRAAIRAVMELAKTLENK